MTFERPLTWFSSSRHSLTLNICEMVKDTARVNPLRLYMRTRPRNGFTSSHTTHPIHATGSIYRAKLSSKKSINSIAVDQSRVESREGSKVESIDRVDRQLSWIDRVARLDRFRGLSRHEEGDVIYPRSNVPRHLSSVKRPFRSLAPWLRPTLNCKY